MNRHAGSYRGPDRRGTIEVNSLAAGPTMGAALVAGVVFLPIGAIGVLAALGLPERAWSTAAGDAAFVSFGAASVILLGLWRLRGDAGAFDLGSATAVLGLFFVPTTARVTSTWSAYLPALRVSTVVVGLGIFFYSIHSPEVRADLRPQRSLLFRTGAVPFLALPLATVFAGVLIAGHAGRFTTIGLLEALAAACVAIALMAKGMAAGRGLFVGAGGAVVAVAGACVALATPLPDRWSALPSLLLLAGSLGLVVVAARELQKTVASVVRQDLRGRRRWEAAETEVDELSRSFRGQRHDVKGMLAAVDWTLCVLLRTRDELPHEEVDRLIGAVRQEIQSLQSFLTTRENVADTYDASEVIRSIVSVHRATTREIACEVESGLWVEGDRDRLAIILNNLLTNAGIHAPNAAVKVVAKRLRSDRGDSVEVSVSDDGPGLARADFKFATQAGWRGSAAQGKPGSGLGLPQCLDLVEAESGDLLIAATDVSADDGHRGFTARVRLPVERLRDRPGTQRQPDPSVSRSVGGRCREVTAACALSPTT